MTHRFYLYASRPESAETGGWFLTPLTLFAIVDDFSQEEADTLLTVLAEVHPPPSDESPNWEFKAVREPRSQEDQIAYLRMRHVWREFRLLGHSSWVNELNGVALCLAADVRKAGGKTPLDPVRSEAKGVALTSDAFNVLAGTYISEHATKDKKVGIRELASFLRSKNPARTCSTQTVHALPIWRAYEEEWNREHPKRGKPPTAVSFTARLEATMGEDDRELRRLIKEHDGDMEPSPLEDDPRDEPPRRVYERKRL